MHEHQVITAIDKLSSAEFRGLAAGINASAVLRQERDRVADE
jgi:hypothetical protein